METIHTILLVIQVLVAFSLIVLVLLQHGKGADAGAAFGSGASGTVFGAAGSGNFMTRATSILAFIFLSNSLGLAWVAHERVQTSTSLMDQPGVVQPLEQSPAPAQAPAAPPPSEVPEVPGSP